MEYTVKVNEQGAILYYKPGTNMLHREDGPAYVDQDGYKAWYKEGKRHREDGPAQMWPEGTNEWYKDGKRHREDGPAIDYIDGRKSWFIEGEKLTEEEFKNRTNEAKVRTFKVPADTKEIRIQFE